MEPLGNSGLPGRPAAIPDLVWQAVDGMMVIDHQRRIVAMNPALERLLGRRSDAVAGWSACGALLACQDGHGCPLGSQPGQCPGLKAMREEVPVRAAEYTIRTATGERRVMSASYTPIRLPGQPIGSLVVMRDITSQKRREHRLARQAKTDGLTGLANRSALLDACFKELQRAIRHQHPLTVAMADLDGFKGYNDTYGHWVGDELLRAIARVLQRGRRVSDLVARYGGDEFGLLFPETTAAGALVVAERLRRQVADAPLSATRGTMPPTRLVTMSMGIASCPEDGLTTEALVAVADRRLYEAKHAGGNQVISGKEPSGGSGSAGS